MGDSVNIFTQERPEQIDFQEQCQYCFIIIGYSTVQKVKDK